MWGSKCWRWVYTKAVHVDQRSAQQAGSQERVCVLFWVQSPRT